MEIEKGSESNTALTFGSSVIGKMVAISIEVGCQQVHYFMYQISLLSDMLNLR